MHTLVSPPDGPGQPPPPEPPAGWERRDRAARQATPPQLSLPAGTAPGWNKPLHAVRVGAAGAQWKQMHGLDKVEGDECFMVYDDKIVRMENFTADSGATIDVVEKVAVYSPSGSVRASSGGSTRAAVPLSRDPSVVQARGRDGAPCVDCQWQPWSSSNLGGQRQAQSAPPARSAAPPAMTLQVPRSAAAGGRDGLTDPGEWQRWSASTLKSAAPASERAESPRVPASERTGSAGAAPSRSDVSMSRQSELSERSDLISQLSDEVRQLRQEQRQLRRELAARSPPPVSADVNVPQLTRVIDQINDALELGLARLQRGEPWRPQTIHAPASLQPYVQAMKLPAPLLNAIVYDPESIHGSRAGSQSASRPGSGRTGAAPVVELDAGYRRINAEQISQLVAEEVRKALREAAPEGRQSRRRPRSTSPAPVRDIAAQQTVRRTHSHDPTTTILPPSAVPEDDAGGRRSSRSSSPPPSVSLGSAPAAYRDFPFLLHLEDGGAAEQMAARQVRAVQESPTSRKIVQLLRDTDPAAPGGEPDLVERVLGVHKRGLEGMYDKKADNMRLIQLLRDFPPEDEREVDHRTAQEIRQLDDEIATLKHTLRALDSTEKLSVWRSPSDELRHLQEKMRQLDGGGLRDDVAAAESKPAESKPVESKPAESKPVESKPVESKPVESKPVESKPVDSRQPRPRPVEDVVVTRKDSAEHHQVVSEGTGSECVVKQPRRPDGRKHTQIVYDTGPKKSPAGARSPLAAAPGTEGASAGAPMAAWTSIYRRRRRHPPQRVHRRFVPETNKPGATRSTPDALVPEDRTAARLVSRSVFETTRGYQTSGEDRYIRAADLEPTESVTAPLAASSTVNEIEVGSYTVSDADRQGMARPATTRDALGLAEGHDAAAADVTGEADEGQAASRLDVGPRHHPLRHRHQHRHK